MRCEVGLSSAVSRFSPHGSDVDALLVQLLDGPETLREVLGQPIYARDHDDVAGPEHLSESVPGGTAHIPPRGDVGEDAVVPEPRLVEDPALRGQAALSLGLGDADVAEDCRVHP